MRIKATINVEYEVDLDNYHLPEECDQEEAIRAIEQHSLSKAVSEVMPWPPLNVDEAGNVSLNKQILKIKLE